MADEQILDAGASDVQGDGGAKDAPAVVDTPKEGDAAPPTEVTGSLLSNDTPAEPVSAAPEQYELVIPEGIAINEEHRAFFEKQAREYGLSNETANAFLKMSADSAQAQKEAHAAQVRGWEEELKNDTEIGGASFAANLEYAKSGLERFDEDGMIRELLHTTGQGSNPAVFKFFLRLGRATSEDKVVTGASKAEEQDLGDRLWGKK